MLQLNIFLNRYTHNVISSHFSLKVTNKKKEEWNVTRIDKAVNLLLILERKHEVKKRKINKRNAKGTKITK